MKKHLLQKNRGKPVFLCVCRILLVSIALLSSNFLKADNLSEINGGTPTLNCDNFTCEAGFFQTIDQDGKLVRYTYNGTELEFSQITSFNARVNSTAYNILDGFLYTINNENNQLIRFDTDGNATNLGFLNLPITPFVGSFDNQGNYYVTRTPSNFAYRIDVNTLAVEELLITSNQKFAAADWVFLDCQQKFYGVGADNYLYSFDPVTLQCTLEILTGDINQQTGFYGGAFTDRNGALYVSNNVSGNIYSIDVDTKVATFLLKGPPSGTNDGASCPCSLPPFPTLFPEDDVICIDNDGSSISILDNDSHSFADLDFSSFEIIVEPENGTVFYTQSTGSVFYLADDESVADSFVYEICLDLDFEFCDVATVLYMPTSITEFSESICAGEEAEFNGTTFTEAGAYEFEFFAANGCDSTVIFNLDVSPDLDSIAVEEVCGDVEFIFESTPFTETGVYEFNFTSSTGCDSTIVLDLTVNISYSDTINQTICEGEEYMFDGIVYTEQGTYSVDYLTEAGCDSIYTINLNVNNDTLVAVEGAICSGNDFELNGIFYSEPGTFMQALTTANGCDSTLMLTLSVLENVETNIVEDLCEGEELISPDGSSIFEAGDYEFVLDAASGCDSTVNLTVRALAVPETELIERICAEEEFTLPDGTVYSETGVFDIVYTAANGCDSLFTLDLTVNEIFEENIEMQICDGESFMIGATEFTESGLYTEVLSTSNNCDSIINLDLVVGEVSFESMQAEICEGEIYSFGDLTLSEGGFYEQNLSSVLGCDSTIMLELTVFERKENNIVVSICNGDAFQLGDTSYSEPGMYDELFVSAEGCDSLVTLDLSIAPIFTLLIEEDLCDNEVFVYNGVSYSDAGDFEIFIDGQGGCDSLINLSIQKFSPATTQISETLCVGEVFTSGGQSFSTAGTFEQNFNTTNGCDSLVTINLAFNPVSDGFVSEEICSGQEISIGGELFSDEGVFEVMLLNSNGCDSTLTVDIRFSSLIESFIEDEICSGEEVSVGGEVFSVGGDYEIMLSTVAGCDSLIHFELMENQDAEVNLERSICEGQEVEVGGVMYNTTGVHTTLLNTSNGCDSLVVLDLLVNPEFEIFESAEICASESFLFGGQEFTESGIHEIALVSQGGCDSLMILDLIVYPQFVNTLDEVICEGSSFSLGSATYSEEGFYTESFTTVNGCDSIVELNLNVVETLLTNLDEGVCAGGSIVVGSETFSEAGQYEVSLVSTNGCDSIVTLDLRIFSPESTFFDASICQGESYPFGGLALTETGDYTQDLLTNNGCDSLVSLNLVVLDIFEFEFDQEICEGETYEIGSSSYNSSGTYMDVFTTTNGCDSLIITHLVVNETSEEQLEMMTCLDDMLGQEVLTLSNINGCDSTVIINTTLSPSSQCAVIIEVEGMIIPCMETSGSIALNVLDGTPPFVVSWTGPTSGSEIVNTVGALTIDNLLPGNYSVIVVDANNNTSAVIAEISEFDVPDLVTDLPLTNSGFSLECNGFNTGSASVMGVGGAMPYVYQWSNGETTSEIRDLVSGIYSVTLTDVNNCVVETEIEITEPPALELILDLVDLSCDDFQSGQITLEASGGVAPYTYSLNDEEAQEEATFIGLEEGFYSSIVRDANGCAIESDFELDMPTAVQVELGEDISIDLGETIAIQAQLNLPAQNLDSVGWSMNLETDCDDCLNQILTPTETTTYTIHVIDENGCEQIDEITVFVDTEQEIYIPNAFSPNGDGINDGFTLYSNSRFSPIISELYVFDRWGNQMFERFDFAPNEESLGWNGMFREKAQNPGVFVYYAKVEFIDGRTAFYKGDVSLIR